MQKIRNNLQPISRKYNCKMLIAFNFKETFVGKFELLRFVPTEKIILDSAHNINIMVSFQFRISVRKGKYL